jgi:hypothetical protein
MRGRSLGLLVALTFGYSVFPASIASANLYTTNLKIHLDASNSSSYSSPGGTWNDLSGQGSNFTLSATAPTFINSAPKNFQLTKSASGGTFFSGSNSWLGGQNFTVSAWIKTTNVGSGTDHWTQMHVMSAESGGLANDWGFGVNGNGKISFGTGGGSDLTYASTTSVNSGNWIFVTATRTYSTGNIKIYVNGSPETTSGSTGNANRVLTSNATLKIGAGDDGGATFGGNIGAVYGYNAVLTDAQVLQNYNATMATYGYTPPDSTAPTFTSSASFSAAENIATSATAATIRVSESATVTISAGADAARFNITRSETNTAIIKFNLSPNFEAPTDVGANNVYEITLTATDAAANAGTQSITITVTDVVETSAFNSLALPGNATTASYRTSIQITANVTVSARVTFRVNGKVLPGCKNRLANGSGSSFSVTCSWRPSNRGQVSLTAAATPTGAGISSATATPVSVLVGNRVGAR